MRNRGNSYFDRKNNRENERNIQSGILKKAKEELSEAFRQEELEPERSEDTKTSRIALEKWGITAVPFYKTVEFSENLDSHLRKIRSSITTFGNSGCVGRIRV